MSSEEQILRDIRFMDTLKKSNELDSFKRRTKFPLKAFIKSQNPCDPDNNHICNNDCSMDHCCEYIAEALMNGTMEQEVYTIYPIASNCRYAYCPFCGTSWGCSPQPGHLSCAKDMSGRQEDKAADKTSSTPTSLKLRRSGQNME